MKRSYLIVPAILLIAFGLFHQYEDIGRRKAAEEEAAKLAAAKTAAEEKKAKLKFEIEDRAQRLAEQRANDERERVDKKRRDFEAALARLAAETATHATEVAKLQSEATTTAEHLAELHAAMERAGRANFDLAKLVEERRIERRSVDLELQRAVHLLATRLDRLTVTDGSNGPASLASRTP